MSKTLKSVISICLVMVLVFGVFTAPIMQPKAEAVAITLTAGTIAVGITLLTMMGITFATTVEAQKAVEEIVGIHPALIKFLQDHSQQGGPNGEPPEEWTKFKMGAVSTAGLASFFNAAKQLFGNSKNSGSVPVLDDLYNSYQGVIVTSGVRSMTSEQLFCTAPYVAGDDKTLFLNGSKFYYSCDAVSTFVTMKCNGEDCLYQSTLLKLNRYYDYEAKKNYFSTGCSSSVVRWGFCLNTAEDGIIPYLAIRTVSNGGHVFYPVFVSDSLSSGFGLFMFTEATEALSPAYTDAPYQNISPYELNIIYNALAEKLKTQEITFDYTQILDQMNNNADQQLQVSQDQLLEQAQIKDLLEQIKAGQGETTKTEIQESDLDVPEVSHDLTWKFPFCVPFDLIALVGALNATPKDPKWEIPFHIESLGFDDSIELDLTKYEAVTQVLRVVMTIFFLLGLIVVTRKMIKG